MPADLTRNVRIYVSRIRQFTHVEADSPEELEIRLSHYGYRLCASVDSATQAFHMVQNLPGYRQEGPGLYYVPGDRNRPPTAEELSQIGQQIEDEYQSIKPR